MGKHPLREQRTAPKQLARFLSTSEFGLVKLSGIQRHDLRANDLGVFNVMFRASSIGA